MEKVSLDRDVVSVLNVSVSRWSRDVFWNVSSRLGLEDITSRSRSRDFSLVNMHAMRIYHEENNGSDRQETLYQERDFTSWCF